MKVHANAKINLCLDVVRKREDGYHEMDMIMVPLALHDTIQVEFSNHDKYECKQGTIAMDENNTIVKAVNLMRKTFAIREHFHIVLDKQIPMEAGLAGGSADGAAVMKAIWQLKHLPCTRSQLSLLGKQIGADVPFCVMNTCALVRGIGEVITPFPNVCDFGVLLVKPARGVSTREAFQTLDFKVCEHPHTSLCKEALQRGDFAAFAHNSGNTLEYSAFRLVPELAEVKQRLERLRLPFVLMSGSGSTFFALSEDRRQLHEAALQMQKQYPFVTVCELA